MLRRVFIENSQAMKKGVALQKARVKSCKIKDVSQGLRIALQPKPVLILQIFTLAYW